jgi:hypothetical protein
MIKRITLIYFTNLILTVIFLIVGIIGILIFPGFLHFLGININSLPKVQLYTYHHWFGLLLIILVSIHIYFHKWFMRTFIQLVKKQLKTKKIFQRKFLNLLISILLLFTFLLLILTGIIKFPGFLPLIGLSPVSVPLNELSILHDLSGVFVVWFTIIHLILRSKWFKYSTKSLFKQ